MNCWCYECSKDIPVVMIVCPNCGNKRCPRATDHRLSCTNSNDIGQVGSTYGVYPHPGLPLLDFLNQKNKTD